VVCVTGDGAFGINAMEIDTAVRHGAMIVVIVSNIAASTVSTRRRTMAGGWWARSLPIRTMPRWRALLELMANVWRSQRTFPAPSSGRSPTPRLWSMW
jgi:hypothetical protein